MKIYERESKNLLVKSKLPDADWVINPYTGCTHHCKYCYAVFMKRFCKCEDVWGSFLIVKKGPLSGVSKVKDDEVVLIGSVTDAYQPIEAKYRCTQAILQKLLNCRGTIEILTKSKLIFRDLELLKKFHKVRVGVSLNTLDDCFRRDMEPGASLIKERLHTLKILKENGIETYLFVSPIFPEITDVQAIIKETKEYVNTYFFENLNLRADYKAKVLEYIHLNYPQYEEIYKKIYDEKDMSYWETYKMQIEELADLYAVKVKLYFYHKEIRKGDK